MAPCPLRLQSGPGRWATLLPTPKSTPISLQIPGDGRELVASLPSAVKIRAEDGRRVEAVDISPFLTNLPMGKVGVSTASSFSCWGGGCCW